MDLTGTVTTTTSIKIPTSQKSTPEQFKPELELELELEPGSGPKLQQSQPQQPQPQPPESQQVQTQKQSPSVHSSPPLSSPTQPKPQVEQKQDITTTTTTTSIISIPPLIYCSPDTTTNDPTSSDDNSTTNYSASIPDSPLPPPMDVAYERECDDRPKFPKSIIPRHSPLPQRQQQFHSQSTAEPIFIVRKKNSNYKNNHSNHDIEEEGERRNTDLTLTDTESASTDKSTISYHASSFLYGVFMGLIPPLIVIRAIFANCFPQLDSPAMWNHRYYVYGRSIGMLILVTVIIIVVAVVIKFN